jgi:hypothetical protein
MKAFAFVCLLGQLSWTCLLPAADTGSLIEPLEPFRPLLDKTWRGEFKKSTPEKPLFDTARWERALNGTAIRVLHSVNDGAYGGETLIQWNKEKKQIVYHYFTTAGFNTSGTMTITGTTFTSHEKVSGGAGGVTDVRAQSELRPDGKLLVKADYFKNDEKVSNREVLYQEDTKASVKFK